MSTVTVIAGDGEAGRDATENVSEADGSARARDDQQPLEASLVAVDLLPILTRAETSTEVVGTMTRFCHDRFAVPVAAWVGGDAAGMALASDRGLSFTTRRALFTTLRTLPHSGGFPSGQRELLRRRLSDVFGDPGMQIIDGGSAVVALGEAATLTRPMLQTLESILVSVLRQVDAVARAKASDESLDLAIACAAHEIRAPLLAARTALEVVQRGIADPVKRSELLGRSLKQLGHLAAVVDGLLRMLAGRQSPCLQQVDLAAVVRDAVESCRTKHKALRRLSLEAPGSVKVRGDAGCLRSVVENVIDNALLYSGHRDRVFVILKADGGSATVAVRDGGPGISTEERRIIFDAFERGAGKGSAPDGRGLGLFLTRRLVEAHGGAVGMESDATGTTFRIELPLLGRADCQ